MYTLTHTHTQHTHTHTYTHTHIYIHTNTTWGFEASAVGVEAALTPNAAPEIAADHDAVRLVRAVDVLAEPVCACACVYVYTHTHTHTH